MTKLLKNYVGDDVRFTTVQKAFIALIIANIIWGAASPIFKLALQNIPPFTLAFWRFFLGAIILAVYVKGKVNLPIASQRDLRLLVAYALFGITANIIFYFWGLKLTYAINAPIIASAQPIVTLFFAMVFLRERFILKKFLGMLVGSIGILVIVIEPLLQTGVDGSFLGNLLMVIAMLAAVAQMIAGKPILGKYNAVTFTFWAFVIGAASFLPLAVFEYLTIPNLYPMLDWRGYLGVVFGAVFSSATAYTIFAWGLSKISTTDVSMFTYIDPVAGIILSFLLLHEPITTLFIVGTILIFGGIFVAEGRIHYHPLHLLRGQKEEKEV